MVSVKTLPNSSRDPSAASFLAFKTRSLRRVLTEVLCALNLTGNNNGKMMSTQTFSQMRYLGRRNRNVDEKSWSTINLSEDGLKRRLQTNSTSVCVRFLNKFQAAVLKYFALSITSMIKRKFILVC